LRARRIFEGWNVRFMTGCLGIEVGLHACRWVGT
jgi:hypothetical protein